MHPKGTQPAETQPAATGVSEGRLQSVKGGTPRAHRLAGAILAYDERERSVEVDGGLVVRAEAPNTLDEQLRTSQTPTAFDAVMRSASCSAGQCVSKP
jgi:hypothetical protein